MRKFVLSLVIVMFCISVASAYDSKEFTFSWDLIESLAFCKWLRNLDDKAPEQLIKLAPEINAGNKMLEHARVNMQKYFKEDSKYIDSIARGVGSGLDQVIKYNKLLVEKIEAYAGKDPVEIPPEDFAEIKAGNNAGRQMIALSASFLMLVIMDFPDKENRNKLIVFKISEEEKDKLMRRLNSLFSEDMNKYEHYLGLKAAGEEVNPDDRFWLTSTVIKLRDILAAKPYGDVEFKKET
jgi:hypothetical protein